MSTLSFIRNNAKWLTVGVLLTFLSSFGQTFFISLFAGHIQDAFDLSHGAWGGIYTVGTGASAVVMIWAGGLCDVFKARTLAPIMLISLAVACIFMAVNPVWWGLFAVIFLLRFSGQGMLSHIAMVAMSRWFTANRGKAISIATLGFGFGEAVLPITFVALMIFIDWRLLWVAGAVVLVLGIPLLMTLLKEERTPQSIAQESQAVGMNERHWTRNQAVSHWLFWFMVPGLLGPSAFQTAFFFHQVHYADIKQTAHVELVAMYPIYTLVAIFAMVISGWGLDRYGTARLMPYSQIPMVLAFLVFAYAGSNWALLLGLIFLGLNAGFNVTLPTAFWSEFYGTGNLGSIKALGTSVMVLGSAIGPGLTGLGIDLGLGLEAQYILIAGFFVLASLLMFMGVARARPMLPIAA
ncbi:MAG: MFS transporter [Pseudomonadota bacterium]